MRCKLSKSDFFHTFAHSFNSSKKQPMKQFVNRLFRTAFLKLDQGMHKAMSSNDGTEGLYPTRILPMEGAFLRWNNYYFGRKVFLSLMKFIDTAIQENMPEGVQPKERRKLEKDMIQCKLAMEITPLEYFVFDFPHLSFKERATYLPDVERWRVLHETFGAQVREEHADKYRFYQLMKPYFHREACKVGPETTKEEFMAFYARHPRFFVKELTGCFGRNAYMLEPKDEAKAEAVFKKMLDYGSWIIEEPIIQSKEMASWNASSVNTVRVASFITREGVHHKFPPLFRAGRVGSVVDNGVSGGVGAGIDLKTGRICTEGFDEHGHHFEKHPDSGVPYMGWQLPEWDELMRLIEEIHRAMPPYHRYVAFDMAHTAQGWVLVEGNWGQLVLMQKGAGRGLKKEFLEYIKP